MYRQGIQMSNINQNMCMFIKTPLVNIHKHYHHGKKCHLTLLLKHMACKSINICIRNTPAVQQVSLFD